MLKTLFDITFAFIGLIIVSPIIILVCVLLLFAEGKTPFFLQKRIGYRKTEFTIIKFRTMIDGEITTIGSVLRKTGIDELPQLLNILMLHMSFVGPRPLTVADVERLGWDDDFYSMRWNVKPGIAGPAQLSPACNAHMSWFFDKIYIKKRSLFFDLKIIFSSFAILFVGKSRVKQWVHKR